MLLNKAPDSDPNVKPTTPMQASGVWASIGSLLGLLLDILPLVPTPLLLEPVRPWLPFAGAVIGMVLNRFFQSSYRPVEKP